MTRKSSRSTPVVISGILYSDDLHNGVKMDSVEWFEFIASGATFYFDDVGFTVRSEKRRQSNSFYAFKKTGGKLHKVYVGRSVAINLTRLRFIAKLFEV